MEKYLDEILASKEFTDSGIKGITDIYQDLSKNEELINKIQIILAPLRKEISEAFRSYNVCFLTGNGSSIYAGTKATTEFHSGMYFDNSKPEENEIYNRIKDENIERVLNNLIILRNYYQLCKEDLSIIDEKIKKIEDDFILNNVENMDYSTLIYHEILLRKLRSSEVLNKTTFFTLNYDLAFEYSLNKLGFSYNNGFSGFINRTFNGRYLESHGDRPVVNKLHGSLNWFVDDNNFDIKERQPIFINGYIKHEVFPYLIYPTSNKFNDSQNYPFSELIRSMLNSLSNNKSCLIITGYKFEDTHINEMLLKSLINPDLIMYVFNFNAKNEFVEKIIDISKKDLRVKYYEGTFISDFRTIVNFLVPGTNQKNDLEIIRKLLLGGAVNE